MRRSDGSVETQSDLDDLRPQKTPDTYADLLEISGEMKREVGIRLRLSPRMSGL